MIRYVSTLGTAEPVDLETAVLNGKAPDGGLYVPDQLPIVTQSNLKAWKSLSYPELAVEVLGLFIADATVPRDDLRQLVNCSFSTFGHSQTIPHRLLSDGIVVQELFQGPTLSFKDVAMGFVVNLFDYFLKRRGERKTLMVATSGDTGPAAAFASIGKSSVSTWVFFPEGLITDEQIRQMTTIMAPNVHAVSVGGCRNGSDDLDELIAHCFRDEKFRDEMRLSSVNSINWARVMTQVVHYFYGYLQNVDKVGDPVHFSVPCGAFGNMCAGAIAGRMGLPIGKLIVSNNANGVLSTALETGTFAKQDIQSTLASAIDIAVPMNFWRHIFFCLDCDTSQVKQAFDQYQTSGRITFSREQQRAISLGLLYQAVSDSEILSTIRDIWNQDGYLLDPHGSVAVRGARCHRPALTTGPIVCLATAHPAKFPEVTRSALGEIPDGGKHASLEAAQQACERKYTCHFDSMTTTVPQIMRAMQNASRLQQSAVSG